MTKAIILWGDKPHSDIQHNNRQRGFLCIDLLWYSLPITNTHRKQPAYTRRIREGLCLRFCVAAARYCCLGWISQRQRAHRHEVWWHLESSTAASRERQGYPCTHASVLCLASLFTPIVCWDVGSGKPTTSGIIPPYRDALYGGMTVFTP